MADVYSQRTRPKPSVLRRDLPGHVRRRLITVLGDTSSPSLLKELERKLIGQYGGLHRPVLDGARQSHVDVEEHFLCCPYADRVLDFLEFWFECPSYRVGQHGVELVNEILRQEAIAYRLSEYKQHEPITIATVLSGRKVRIDYPRVIPLESEVNFTEIVAPALAVLGRKEFQQANSELLDAFARHRRGDFDGTLTCCGSAFESVLKTICTVKRWPFDPKSTLASLVQVCNEKSLFPPFYAPIFISVGTIRNNLSDAHGRGPTLSHDVTQDHAEHLLHLVCSHIVLLAKLAGI